MAEIRRILKASGALFDVAALEGIPSDDCHILVVSGRTLYLMEHFARNEVNWLARYAEEFVNELWYRPVDLDSAKVEFVQRTAQDYRVEVNDLNCEAIIGAIDNLAAQIGLINVALQGQAGGCGCDGGVLDPGELDIDDVPIGPGEQFENFGEYQTAKCRVANVILDKVISNVRLMDSYNVDAGFGSLLGVTTGLITAALLAGPVGWVVAISIGAVSGIITVWATLAAPDLGDLDTALASNQDDLICALFEAQSAEAAKTAFLAVLDGASVSAALQSIVGFMLYFGVLNELFSPTGTYAQGTDYLNDDYDPTDCAECGPSCTTFYSFDESAESWEFTDQSTGGNSATGEWDEVAGALQVAGDSGSGSGTAIARWKFAQNETWAADTTITLRYSGPADGNALSYRVGAVRSGVQTFQALADNETDAGELTLTITVSGIYTEIWVQAARQAPSNDFETGMLDVCIVEA